MESYFPLYPRGWAYAILLAQLFALKLPSKVTVDLRSQASSLAVAMSHQPLKATPPKSSPLAIPYLAQAAEDLPKLKEEERMAVLRVETRRRNLAKAEEDLLALRGRIAKKEATMAVAVASLQREEEKKKKLAAEPSAVRPSKAPKYK